MSALSCFSASRANPLCFPSNNYLPTSCWTPTYSSRPQRSPLLNTISQHPSHYEQQQPWEMDCALLGCVMVICVHICLSNKNASTLRAIFFKSKLIQKLSQIHENLVWQYHRRQFTCKFWVRSCVYLKFCSSWIFCINVDFLKKKINWVCWCPFKFKHKISASLSSPLSSA